MVHFSLSSKVEGELAFSFFLIRHFFLGGELDLDGETDFDVCLPEGGGSTRSSFVCPNLSNNGQQGAPRPELIMKGCIGGQGTHICWYGSHTGYIGDIGAVYQGIGMTGGPEELDAPGGPYG